MSQIRRICLFGGPGSGKSTTTARIFTELKIRGYDIEHVTEYIKTWAYEGRMPQSYDQLYVFAKQIRSEDVLLRRGVQYIVTDSPVLMNAAYSAHYGFVAIEQLIGLSKQFDRDFPAVNLFIERSVPYVQKGRFQNPDEAVEMDKFLYNFLSTNLEQPITKIKVDDFDNILSVVESAIQSSAD